MQYRITSLVAAAIILMLGIYAWFDRDVVVRNYRAQLRLAQQQGRLPPELQNADIDSISLDGYSIETTSSLIFRQKLARFLALRWYLWAPVVVALSFGLAAAIGYISRFIPRRG